MLIWASWYALTARFYGAKLPGRTRQSPLLWGSTMVFDPIQTDRLLLRRPTIDDAAGLARRRSEPEVARYQSWAHPFPFNEAEKILTELAAMTGPQDDRWWMAVIDHRDSGETVGDVAVRLEQGRKVAEIGYTLSSRHWGQGYATEAVGAMITHLFRSVEVGRVGARLAPDNIASARVLERTGFVYEGRTRLSYWPSPDRAALKMEDGSAEQPGDDLLYGLTRDDWDRWRNRPTGPPGEVRLTEITADNRRAVLALQTHKSQEQLVAPIAVSFCDALFPPNSGGRPRTPLMRAIEADDEPVGFVMLAPSDAEHPEPYLWRLLIDRMHQRRGIGNRALEQLETLCAANGDRSMIVHWAQGPGSPEPFYLARGFQPTGRVHHGEIEGRKQLEA